jgi:hypothetical protein
LLSGLVVELESGGVADRVHETRVIRFQKIKFTANPFIDIRQIIRHISCMKTNVTTLLREFPRVRRVALRGEPVLISSREGDLLLTAAPKAADSLLGAMSNWSAEFHEDLTQPTSSDPDWVPSL